VILEAMPKYKNISIKKRGGGTRKQRVQVLKSGKYKFVKNTKRKSSSKTSKRKVNKTAKRRRRYTKKKKRSSGRKRLPLSVINGTLVSVFGAPNPGWSSVADNFSAGNYVGAAQSFLAAWTGLRLGGIGGQAETEIDIFGVINPFDMRNAPAAKTMLWTKLATKITRKLAGNPFTRIPFLKDYISFS